CSGPDGSTPPPGSTSQATSSIRANPSSPEPTTAPLRYGADEWVRNGDRWTVNAGTRDELYLTNTVTGDRLALPADYIAAGNVTVNYASTIHRAQGVSVPL